jgi:hypothetical protein|tara:strand:+ start:687 stop:2912 length:2226 start_codon:yes stop_codon:yes gene_type:complete
MLTQVNYEVKGQLAKLLATEDLIIENRPVPTASFDVEKRVLTLPMWEKASGTVYDLLVGHEVGHALYTPADNWLKEFPEIPMSFVNVFEDVRIEKFMKKKYPGLGKTFYNGYSQLAEQDFFEIDDKDQEEINLADRINLYYKIGNFVDIEFEDDEKIFVEKATRTETFEDVLNLSLELTKFLKEKMDNLEKTEVPMSNGGTDIKRFPLEDLSTGRTEDTDEEDTDMEMEGDSGKSEKSEEENLDFEDLDYDDHTVGGQHHEMEAQTDKAFEDNLKNLNKNTEQNSYYDPEYIEIPKLNLDTLVASNADVHEYLQDHWIKCQKNWDENSDTSKDIFEPVDNKYRLFRRTAQKEVNYLVKEFECRKSADAYSRATVAKTGVIDCNKLHTYKYNEDLFRKITTIPDGKNHGLIFVLDWSGSMSYVLEDTIKQLFNLIWFCKKVNIPFQVFAFTNEWSCEDCINEYGYTSRSTLPKHHEQKDGHAIVDSMFSMVEFLSSDCKKSEFEKQMLNIWRVTAALTATRRWDCQVYYQYPRRLSLSGTPLNEALVSLNQLIPLFQKKQNVQKIQCITLTDGEAHPLRFSKLIRARHEGDKDYLGERSSINGNTYIRDRKTGKTYFCKSQYHELTSALLNQLRGRFPNVNFIGIRVLEKRNATSFIRKYLDWDFDSFQTVTSEWKKNKSCKLTDVGYHAYFGLSSSALNNDTEFEVHEDATKAQIKSAFKKSLNSKKMNKKVLSEFMEYIA